MAPRQGGLFGPLDEGRPARAKVLPHRFDDDLRALGAALPARLRLGTSSWNFPGFRGLVYATDAPLRHLSRHGLSAYAKHPLLRTVGVDRTFYRPITADDFRHYREQVPDQFRFLVKAWHELLQPTLDGRPGWNPRYLDPDEASHHCVQPAQEGLGDALGTLLLQFPPQGRELTREPQRFADRLHTFLRALPPAPYAVELRDAALCTDAYRDALAAAGASHCYCVHPRMPSLQEQRAQIPVTANRPLVARWMLHPGLHYEAAKQRFEPFDAIVAADDDNRAALATLCQDALALDVATTVVVNNKAEGSSPHSIIALARAILGAAHQPE